MRIRRSLFSHIQASVPRGTLNYNLIKLAAIFKVLEDIDDFFDNWSCMVCFHSLNHSLQIWLKYLQQAISARQLTLCFELQIARESRKGHTSNWYCSAIQ